MAKEICISSTPHETRLAILEDDQLAEIYYERENEYTLAGSIYNGRVTRVLPGMQSAFVDIGLERDAFLYVTDFLELEDQEETDELEKAAASSPNQPPREVRQRGSPQWPAASPSRAARTATGATEVERRPPAEPPNSSTPDATCTPRRNLERFAETQDPDEPGAKRWRGRRRRRGGRGRLRRPRNTGGIRRSRQKSQPRPMPQNPTQESAREVHAGAGSSSHAPTSARPLCSPR